MSGQPWMHIDPRQIPTGLKEPAMDAGYPPDIDDDPYDGDEDPRCTHCEGEVWVECDDPIQCCTPGCDGELHPDPACNGTGLAKHQWLW